MISPGQTPASPQPKPKPNTYRRQVMAFGAIWIDSTPSASFLKVRIMVGSGAVGHIEKTSILSRFVR
jgi:hypothetical protein